jgi:hypothetical protein
MYNFVKGSRLFMKGKREENDDDNIYDPSEKTIVADDKSDRVEMD